MSYFQISNNNRKITTLHKGQVDFDIMRILELRVAEFRISLSSILEIG